MWNKFIKFKRSCELKDLEDLVIVYLCLSVLYVIAYIYR